MTDLSKRAVACKHWRWMPGMLATHRWIVRIRVLCDRSGEASTDYVVRPGPDGNEVHAIHDAGVMGSFPRGDGSAYPMLPDLDDPATLGCLIQLVRDAWGDPLAGCFGVDDVGNEPPEGDLPNWYVDMGAERMFSGFSEAEALVAALEAAP